MTVRLQKINLAEIAKRIVVVRGQRVLLDSDPQLEINELRSSWPQTATSSKKFRGPSRRSQAFTEHGAIMAATILNSARAIQISVYVVRAFVTLRRVLASNTELARKLANLEQSLAKPDAQTRRQVDEVYAAIRGLMEPATTKRSIGFTADI